MPQDVALVGCDNDAFGAYLDVPLTTVDFGVPEITRRAVAALAEKIERIRAGAGAGAQPSPEAAAGTADAAPRMVPARLVVRRSCGAVRDEDPTVPEGARKVGKEVRGGA